MTRRLSITFAAIIASAAVVAIPAAPAHAIALCKADNECVRWYYSNVNHSTLVGSTYLFCNGTTSTVGEITGFIVTTNTPCN